MRPVFNISGQTFGPHVIRLEWIEQFVNRTY